MKKLTFIGKLVNYERRNSSVYGNPKYYGEFEGKNGEYFNGVTATDSSCAYAFTNQPEKERKVDYHITRNGNVIIDYITIL